MSEPIFEASVRLQVDVSSFEQQAQASVKKILDGIEQQTQQAIRNAQQLAAQRSQLAQQQAQQPLVSPRTVAPNVQAAAITGPTPATVPVQMTLVPPEPPFPVVTLPPAEVHMVVVPPAELPPGGISVDTPPVPIDSTLTPPDAQDVENVENLLGVILGQNPAQIPTELTNPTNTPEITLPPAEQPVELVEPVAPTPPPTLPPIEQPVEVEQPVVPEVPQPPPVQIQAEVAPVAPVVAQEVESAQRVANQNPIELQLVAPPPPPPPPGGGGPNGPDDELERTLARARALAESQPVSVDFVLNTEPFERDVNVVFERVKVLAQERADALAQIAEAAEEAAQDARKAASARGQSFEQREAALAVATTKREIANAAREEAQNARDLLDQVTLEAEAALTAPRDVLTREAQASQSRSTTAGIQGDAARQEQLTLDAAVKAQAAQAENFALEAAATRAAATEQVAAVTQLEAASRDATLAAADTLTASAEKARAETAKLQAEGLAPVPDGPGGPNDPNDPNRRGGFLDAFRSTAAGRSSGLGGLIGGAARFGVAGFAASAAFQTFNELTNAIRVTGDEAFTTQGKIRNLGAELLTGNIVGGIKALTADRPAIIAPGVTEAIKASKLATDELFVSEDKLISKFNEGEEALATYLVELEGAGAISEDTANDLAKVAEKLAQQREAAINATTSLNDFQQAVARAGSEAALFGREGGIEGRGPGQLGIPQAGQGVPGQVVGQQQTGIPRPIITQPFPNPVFQAGSGGEEVANQIRASLAERIRNDEERLRAELRNRQIIQKQAREAFENAKEAVRAGAAAGSAADEYEKLVAATTGVANAAQAIRDQAQRAAEEMQAAEDRIANARVSAIRDPAAQAQAQLQLDQARQAREGEELAQAREDFKKKTISAGQLKQAEAEYAEAVAATKITQNQITEAQEDAATAARNSRLSAEQQGLENEIAKAALTKRLSDDKAAFAAAIAYWRNLASEAGTAEEREAAQAKVIQLRQQREQALNRSQQQTGEDVELLRIQNRIAAAGLTDRISDDRRFTKELIAYWQEKVNSLKGEAVEQERARSQLIAARLALKRLDEQRQQDSPEIFAQELFQRAVDEFNQFGSNISSSPNGLLAPQDARGFFAGALGGGLGGAGSTVERFAQAQLSEARTSNDLLTQIAANTATTSTNTATPRPKAPIAPQEGRASVEIGADILRGQ